MALGFPSKMLLTQGRRRQPCTSSRYLRNTVTSIKYKHQRKRKQMYSDGDNADTNK